MQYNTTFYASPVVLISAHHHYDRKTKSYVPPENNIITAWVEVRYRIILFINISANCKELYFNEKNHITMKLSEDLDVFAFGMDSGQNGVDQSIVDLS